MPSDRPYILFNFSDLFLPGELMNESISEMDTPLKRIQLSPDGKMIMNMMANRGSEPW